MPKGNGRGSDGKWKAEIQDRVPAKVRSAGEVTAKNAKAPRRERKRLTEREILAGVASSRLFTALARSDRAYACHYSAVAVSGAMASLHGNAAAYPVRAVSVSTSARPGL